MKKICLFGLLILTIFSCQKSSLLNATPVDTVKKTTTDTTKKTPIDTVKKTPTDTVKSPPAEPPIDTMLVSAIISKNGVSHFQYDNKKRLVFEVDSIFSNGSVETVLNSSFNYDSQGNLIRREVSSKNNRPGYYSDTVYNITYVNRQPVSASYFVPSAVPSKYPDQTGTITYTVADGKVVEIDGSVYPKNLVLKITYSGNNIASIKGALMPGTNALIYKYGTQKSPFAASRFKWFLFPDSLPTTEWVAFGYGNYTVNMYNLNSLELMYGQYEVIPFTNQYNNLGYPTQVTTSNGTITYQYIK